MPERVDDAPRRRCDNPECTEFVNWPERSSRPPRFCSSACRQRCRATFDRLAKERDELGARIRDQDLRYVDRRQFQSRLAAVEWLMSAYPYERASSQP